MKQLITTMMEIQVDEAKKLEEYSKVAKTKDELYALLWMQQDYLSECLQISNWIVQSLKEVKR